MTDIPITNPLVIDNGTGVLKAGFAGEERPSCCFQSCVGRPKHQRVMAGGAMEERGAYLVGSEVEQMRGILKIQYPMEHGFVTDWEAMERVWSHLYKNELKKQPEDHPVLLTEAPLNPRANREKLAEVFFESFSVPAVHVSLQAVLSLYASGRTTGVVLDSGDGVTHAVPVFESFALTHAITRIDVAGRDVTNYLQRLLRRAGYAFHTSAEREVVREMKERVCYVAKDPLQEEEAMRKRSGGMVQYKLPDERVINLGAELFTAPELLFRPEHMGSEYMGIAECLTAAIQKSDLDVRKTLYSQIVLSGGSTMFKGFGARLLSEVIALAPPQEIKVRMQAPPERKFSTWMGGSVLASLSSFKNLWVTMEEYEEKGAAIIHRKML